MNQKSSNRHLAKASSKKKNRIYPQSKIATAQITKVRMDIVVQLCVALAGVVGAAALIYSLLGHHRDTVLWLGCALAIFSVVAFFAGLQDRLWKADAANDPNRKHESPTQPIQVSRKIQSPNFGILPENFTFSIGNLVRSISRSELEKGPVDIIEKPTGGTSPLSVALVDGKFIINADFYLKSGRQVIIRDSLIREMPETWDMNHNVDWTIVEIINEVGKPVLQLTYKKDFQIGFEGIWSSPFNFWVMKAVEHGQSYMVVGPPAQQCNINTFDAEIPQIFKYPSAKFRGVFADVTPAPAPQEPSPTPSTSGLNVNVTSNNQKGGITAGIINVGSQPRRFSEEQKKSFSNSLKNHTVGDVGFELDPNVQDSEVFANDILQSLAMAGIKPTFVNNVTNIGPAIHGVRVGCFQGNERLVLEIISAFESTGIKNVKKYGGDHREPESVVIQIGRP